MLLGETANFFFLRNEKVTREGRVAHESIFNVNDGQYRCPNSQQGYSPFSTWKRGLAWIMCGYSEQVEYLDTLEVEERSFSNP